jgi:hypothetical protein
MDNPNSTPIYQYVAPMSASLEPPEPIILASSYELRPCLVAIGHNQPFSTVGVLSSHQEGNELLATPKESFNLLINSGLDPALQDLVLLQHFYMGLNLFTFEGVFLSFSISGARFVLISGHTPCTSLHDEFLEEKKEFPRQDEEVSIATLQTFQSHDLAINPKPLVLQNPVREKEIPPLEILSNNDFGGA